MAFKASTLNFRWNGTLWLISLLLSHPSLHWATCEPSRYGASTCLALSKVTRTIKHFTDLLPAFTITRVPLWASIFQGVFFSTIRLVGPVYLRPTCSSLSPSVWIVLFRAVTDSLQKKFPLKVYESTNQVCPIKSTHSVGKRTWHVQL